MTGKFIAETTADLQAIEARLQEAEHELLHLSRSAPQAALRIELGKAEDGDAEIVERLPVARALVDRLTLAKDAAEQAELGRRNENFLKDDEARRRAVSQHLARAQAAVAKWSSALDAAVRAYDDARTAFAAARAAAPPDLRVGDDFVVGAFSDRQLSQLFLSEIARACEAKQIAAPLWQMPYTQHLRDGRGVLRSAADVIADRVARVKRDLASGAARMRERFGQSTETAHSPVSVTAGAGSAFPPAPGGGVRPEWQTPPQPSRKKIMVA